MNFATPGTIVFFSGNGSIQKFGFWVARPLGGAVVGSTLKSFI